MMWSDQDAVVVGERDCTGGAQTVMHQSLSMHLKRGWNEVQ